MDPLAKAGLVCYACKHMMTLCYRSLGDRRSRPTPFISRYALFGGRRRSRRRASDPRSYYVDRLGEGLWLLLLSIFLLQVLDAYLTLGHLRHGGIELNPVMKALIASGRGLFVAVKLAVAAAGLVFLGIHKNFPMAKPGLVFLFALFLGVVGWHCLLTLQQVI